MQQHLFTLISRRRLLPPLYKGYFSAFSRQRPYHVESTGSRPITEVKQRRARLVLGWVTAWEHWVLLATFSLSFFSKHLPPPPPPEPAPFFSNFKFFYILHIFSSFTRLPQLLRLTRLAWLDFQGVFLTLVPLLQISTFSLPTMGLTQR